ncbi:MAG TPA: hypothetical protein VHM91_24585 [Verrucomicrobiales bacterium]|nr:hypothetical protein [Verrucomicrobiales bacterium]
MKTAAAKLILMLGLLLGDRVQGIPDVYPRNEAHPPPLVNGGEYKLEKAIKDVCFSEFHCMTLFKDGTVKCSGRNDYGQCEVPPDLRGVKEVYADDFTSVALTGEGRLVYWGLRKALPGGDGLRAKTITGGDAGLVILATDGRVWRWKPGDGPPDIYSPAQKVIQILGDHGLTCLTESGTLLRLAPGDAQDELPKVDGPLEQIQLYQSQYVVALGRDGRFFSSLHPNFDPSLARQRFRRISCFLNSAYGLLKSGEVFGLTSNQVLPLPPAKSKMAVAVRPADEGCVVLFSDGTGWTYGYDRAGVLRPPVPRLLKSINIGGGSGFVLVCDDGTPISRHPGGDRLPVEGMIPAGIKNIQCATSTGTSIALSDGKGALWAWGENDYGQCNVPPKLGPVVQLAAGRDFFVALQADGRVSAWGRNDDGATGIGGLTSAREIAAGPFYTIALRKDGGIVQRGKICQGNPAPPAGQMFVKIAAGIEHALALTADFRVRAWGGNRAGECQVPADLPPAAGIAAGGVYSLALLKDGSLRMWGEERCRLPPGLPKLKAVWASYDMVGGLTLDGKALVFSVDPRLQNRLALPAGLFPVWQPSK